MKKYIDLVPFLRITLAFIIGITTGWYALLSLLLLLHKRGRELWIYIIIIACGSVITFVNTLSPTPPYHQKLSASMVISDSISNRYLANIVVLDSALVNIPILLELNQHPTQQLVNGDTITTMIYIEPADQNMVSDKSPTATFMRRGGVAIAYTYNNEKIYLNKVAEHQIATSTKSLISTLSNRLDRLTISKENIAILKAMTLGIREGVSKPTKMLYRKAGITHSLAISGLHIGIIFMIINILLYPLNLTFITKVLKILIVILLLTYYAYMVGFAPAIVRATIMFSAMQLTTLFVTSKYHIYNILLFACFIMLAYDPIILYDVSFQLSYVAMIAVILFGDWVGEMYSNKGKILKFTLSTLTITLLISTFILPLGLYYFGSGALFPVLSNLALAILLTPLFIATILFLIAPIPLFDTIIGAIFTIIDGAIAITVSLPFNYISFIRFDLLDLVMSYASITLLIIYFRQKWEINKNYY